MIISNNDEMAIGAVEAYKKSGYGEDEWPIICGIDGLNDALIAVKEGQMQGTVYNDKEDQSMEIAKHIVFFHHYFYLHFYSLLYNLLQSVPALLLTVLHHTQHNIICSIASNPLLPVLC